MDEESYDEYYVQYNAKDVVHYALSIGAGTSIDSYSQDIQYVFEDHSDFSVVPTFAFVLIFWANRSGDGIGNTLTIPRFPPPIMKSMGVIPKESLKTKIDVHKFPLIHTSQSIIWENDLPIPTKQNNYVVVMIKGKFLSVTPKTVGTFVTTEYVIHQKTNDVATNGLKRIGRVQFTTLILGIPIEMVYPYNNTNNISFALNEDTNSNHILSSIPPSIENKRRLLLEVEHYISPNTALMYRLASGDSNPMHVDPNALPDMGHNDHNITKKEKLPFIHGLCTLGIVARMILQDVRRRYCDQTTQVSARCLDCRFKMPVFINDTIIIRAWAINENNDNSTISIEFNVAHKSSDSILVDSGKMLVSLIRPIKNAFKLRSYL